MKVFSTGCNHVAFIFGCGRSICHAGYMGADPKGYNCRWHNAGTCDSTDGDFTEHG